MRYLQTFVFAVLVSAVLIGQDTITVQTLTFDSTGRDYYFDFPEDDGTTYRKIVMEYGMRCKGAQVSTVNSRNLGCGEWDYSCNTFIVDEDRQDSVQAQADSYEFAGWAEEELPYVLSPVFDYYEEELVSGSPIPDSAPIQIDMATASDASIALGDHVTHVRQLILGTHLTNQGLSAGDIYGLTLSSNMELGTSIVQASVQASDENVLVDLPIESTRNTLFNKDLTLSPDGDELWFCTPFNWDGTSNILLDLAIRNPNTIDGQLMADATAQSTMHTVMYTDGQNQYLELDGNTAYAVEPSSLGEISSEITVEFWAYGNPDLQPVANSIIEGEDADNIRELNIHLPWGNGTVFFDCGNEGGYDRVSVPVDPSIYEGSWHHYAFTKNATTGRMAIYIDGEVAREATDRTNMIGMTSLTLGANRELTNYYPGYIDELRIFNIEKTTSEIQDDMRRSINDSAFREEGLLYSFSMNEDDATLLSDLGQTATLITGTDRHRAYRINETINGYKQDDLTLTSSLIQGDVEVECISGAAVEAVEQTPVGVTAYDVEGTDLVIDSVFEVYAATVETTYGPDGSVKSTADITPEGTIAATTLDYYAKTDMRFEIMSFVTPYGINLDFGTEGRSWTFDVTDYTPILKGRKRMFLGNGGQNQEEMDIRFHFIKGTPPREVLDITQIWRPGAMATYEAISTDQRFEPRMVTPRADASYLKVRTMVTGHGQEGEFIPRTHYLSINGLPEFDWQAWKECADNPVFPQGGTWVFDRAGWCPGMATDLQEFDLEDFVEQGETFEVDYSMSTAVGDSRYLVNHQLVSYGEYNYDYDLAIDAVMRPSNRVEFGRYNPTCDQPTIILRNQGAERITSATITYRMGGQEMTHTWTGTLRPERTTQVELPTPDLATLASIPPGLSEFEAEITSINDGNNTDTNPHNDHYLSTFEMPVMYDAEEYVIQLRTNNFGTQNALTVTDYDGNALISRSTHLSNTNYNDTLQLGPGCYTIELQDRGDNGLEFFAAPGDGSGAMRLRGDNRTLLDFEEDFGSVITHTFVVSEVTNVKEVSTTSPLSIYPNPTSDYIVLDLDPTSVGDVRVVISDQLGQTIYNEKADSGRSAVRIDVGDYPNGVYTITTSSSAGTLGSARFVKL